MYLMLQKDNTQNFRVWSKEVFMIEKVPIKEMGDLMDHKPILLAGPGQGFTRVSGNMCAEDLVTKQHQHGSFWTTDP